MPTAERVLLVGRRADVLRRLADALSRHGLHVRQETDVEQACTELDGSKYDVLALGRGVVGTKRDSLISALRARNPSLRVVDGLAPITALQEAQVQEALGPPAGWDRIVASAWLDPGDERVVLSLRRPADVTVELFRLDLLYRAHEQRLHSGRLDAGRHVLPKRVRFRRAERFLVVRADGQTSVHPIN
ncbi:MAG: hypothetical protein ICV70_01190 [Jiangellaceae bacterium]|nr:hypothetical protein [Jiangellaceae bacterium]